MSPQDSANNFFLYSKGNVTYTGTGATTELTDDEVKLFVNTIIAAYRPLEDAPTIYIDNADATGNLDRTAYIYIDYDAVAQTQVSGKVTGGYIDVQVRIADETESLATKTGYYLFTAKGVNDTATGDVSYFDTLSYDDLTTTYQLVDTASSAPTAYIEKNTEREGIEASLGEVYTLRIPYDDFVKTDGNYVLRFTTYATYQHKGKTVRTKVDNLTLHVMYMPLFKLD
jgi:hypothetical protein